MAQQLQTTDAQIQATLSAISGYMDRMRSYAHTVEDIKGRVASGYHAESSAKFQQRLDDWLERYHLISTRYGQLYSDLQAGAKQIASGEELAIHQA